ncbi:glycosyltransferase [Postechiella marina]
MNPKVSIIIPIYNSYSFLERCFSSLENQSLKDLEFILINDGSVDDSESLCHIYSKKDERFKYYFKENGGLSSARNYGLNKAKGDYIFFLDSDDYIEAETCNTLYKLAEKQNIDLLNFGYKYIYNDRSEKRNSVFPKNKIITRDYILDKLKRDTVKNKLLWFSTTYFYKRAFLSKHHLTFNPSILLGEDSEFNLRCLLSAKRLYSINDHFYNYVFNTNSLTQANYKHNLLPKFYSQFESRLAVHNKFNLLEPAYLLEISRNYIEHSLFQIFNNIYKNKTKVLNPLSELKKIRTHELYKFCFKHYKFSNSCGIKKKVLIFLFKYNFLVILNSLLKKRF